VLGGDKGKIMKLLAMCSSRNRPKELVRMLDSFDATHTEGLSEIRVYISEDDPHLSEYRAIPEKYLTRCLFGPHKYLVEVNNFFSTITYPGLEYYQEINDDHIYHTPGWDQKLIKVIEEKGQGWGYAFGSNGIDQNPGGTVMSGNMVRTLGWFDPPELRHSMTDAARVAIGKWIKRLFYVDEVFIEHRCWHDGLHGFGVKAPWDENMKFVYGNEEISYGIQMAQKHKFDEDVAKLNKAILADGKDLF
jgi:hypothetical protein